MLLSGTRTFQDGINFLMMKDQFNGGLSSLLWSLKAFIKKRTGTNSKMGPKERTDTALGNSVFEWKYFNPFFSDSLFLSPSLDRYLQRPDPRGHGFDRFIP